MTVPKFIPPRLLAILMLAVSPPAHAAAPEPLWTAGAPEVSHSQPALPQGVVESPSGAPLRIIPPSRTPEGKRNELTLQYRIPVGVDAGRWIQIECRMRAVAASSNADGQAGLVLDLAPLPPPDAGNENKPRPFFRHILLVGPDWETFRLPVKVPQNLEAGRWRMTLAPSFFEQGIELDGLKIVPAADGSGLLSAAVYPGQEPDAPWRKEAAARIEKHRMADLKILVVDALGKPVPGASVSVRQTRHAYPFGTCVVASRLVDAPRKLPEDTTREQFLADNARYRSEILRLFNFAVFENDMKWPFWNGRKPDVFRQDWTMDACRWLEKNGLAIKGHTMLWASWRNTPSWLRDYENDPAELQRIILRHISDIGAATRNFCAYWDVLNEPMSHRDLIELLGPDAVAGWFKAARAAVPESRLVLNEFDIVGNGGSDKRRADLLALVKQIQDRQGSPDLLGFQSHFWSERLTPPERIWKIIDEVHAVTGLPVMASEFDMNFPNEQVQAEYTRDFLTAWFAHPATEAFIMWGFWGGSHWFGESGAMFRKDWSPKPNLEAYTNLVFRDWWTKADAKSDPDGSATVRAFLGDHRVEITAPGHVPATRDLRLGKGGLEITVVLPTDSR